jgi:hypothetical protein
VRYGDAGNDIDGTGDIEPWAAVQAPQRFARRPREGETMSEATCATCPWWSRYGETDSGACGKWPPQDAGLEAGGGEREAMHITGYSLVATRANAWCGVHPARVP